MNSERQPVKCARLFGQSGQIDPVVSQNAAPRDAVLYAVCTSPTAVRRKKDELVQ